MIALLPLTLVVLLVLVLLVRVAMLVMSRRSRVEQPSCGTCGYPVAGLEGVRCPECGRTLLQVGIQTPTMRRDPGPAAKITVLIVLWTILLPFPALLLTGLAFRSLPTSQVVRLSLPASSAYREIMIVSGADEAPGEGALVELRGNDGSRSRPLEIDVTDVGKLTYRPEGSDAPRALDRQAIVAWMTEAGVAAGSTGLPEEAGAMIVELRAAAAERGTGVTAGGAFGGVSWAREPRIATRPWFKVVVPGFWLLVWMAGILGIARRYRACDRAETR